jgi:hypothetical protein
MDEHIRCYYSVVFERDFLRRKASEFQNFFADLMEKRYPGGDFIRVRPWGAAGDRKNDGYLKSERTLFQVYAPNEMKESEALRKIDEDFTGALSYWREYFDHWVFVHNARDGVGPGITRRLLDLDRVNQNVRVLPWGYEDLRRVLFAMSEEDIAALLGPAPGVRDFLRVGFEDVKVVLQFIARQDVCITSSLQRVPRDKIEINKLSKETAVLIAAGRCKSTLVGKFLEQYPDPEYADEIVQAFKAKYDELKNGNHGPDRIFHELQIFAGGERMREPRHQAAVLSVLAYLFDHCDVFESTGGLPQ